MSREIILNRIQTPDGTVLISYHRHDYNTHVDKNGKEYMVDGGRSYLRRNVHEDAPYKELSIYSDAPYEVIRENFYWGTRGPKGDQSLKWVALKDLDTDHIQAILDNVISCPEKWLLKELAYRKEN